MYPINKMTLYVTRYCNLDCQYCFVDRKREHMDWATAKQSFDWLIGEASGKCRDLSVGFFGGEPMVVYKLLLRLLEYGTAEAAKAGKTITFSIPTNGVLLTKERAGRLSQYPLLVAVSIDGDSATHDRLRRRKDGRGTYDQLLENISQILHYLPHASARMTVTPQTVANLAANIEHIYELGFREITIGHNSYVSWSIDDLSALDRELRKVANLYLALMIDGERLGINIFDNSLKNLISGARPATACGAGKGLVSVGLDGDIYPCHHFTCLNNFEGAYRLGDLQRGVDENLRTPFLRYDAGKSLGCLTSCDECRARPICGGGCFAKAYEHSGLLQMPPPIEQKFTLIVFDIVRDLYDALLARRPKRFLKWQRQFAKAAPLEIMEARS